MHERRTRPKGCGMDAASSLRGMEAPSANRPEHMHNMKIARDYQGWPFLHMDVLMPREHKDTQSTHVVRGAGSVRSGLLGTFLWPLKEKYLA